MRYSLRFIISASVFLLTFPVEAVVKDGLSVASEEVKIAQGEGIKQRNKKAFELYRLGVLHFNKSEFRKALKTFEQALVIVKENGELQGKGVILNYIGNTYLSLGEYPKALDYYQQALSIYKQVGNKPMEGTTLNNIGEVYRSLGEYTKALDYYQQSFAIHKQVGNKLMEGTTLNNIGLVYDYLGEYLKALDYYQQSLVISKQIGNQADEGITLNNIGEIYRSLAQYPKALDYNQQSLAIFKKIGNQALESTTLNNIGLVYNSLGEYPKALDYYQKSLAIFKKIGNKAFEGNTLNNIGEVYRSLAQYPKALDYYQKSLAISKQIGNKTGEGTNLNNIGLVYNSLGEYPKALGYYQQSLAIFKQIGNQADEGNTLNNIGEVYRSLTQYPKALDYYQKSLAISKQLGNKLMEGTTLNNTGNVYNSLGEYPKALDYYQQALAIAKQIGNKPIEGTTLSNVGALYKITGKYAEAEKTLFAAIEILESLRPGLTDDQKISIFETQSGIYGLLQDILIAQNQTTTALEISERSKARALVELLSSKINRNQLSNIKPPNIKQIKQIAQQQKATFVEYSFVKELVRGEEQWHPKLYIWVIKPTGEIAFKQVDIKSLDIPLTEIVKNSRVSIGARGRAGIDVVPVKNPVNQKQNLQKLHELLIKPIASHLPTNPDERVIFIPHESLFLVPFPALMDASGKYLIEKHTIMTAPAIQVLELTNKNNAQKLNLNSLKPKDLLVVGNPTMPIVGIPPVQLSPLKGAETEAKAIAQLFNTTALTGNQATKSTVLQKISSARVIHFATHGLLDGKDFGELTPGAIALAPDTFNKSDKLSDVNEGLLKTTEIIDLKLNADLVVLSACDTGRGQITGDGVIGLSRSLITAGASSVIVSLWKIPDDSTSELMTEFYRQWEKTGDKAKALRQAMLITMKTNPEPIDWAAFTLIGEAE